MRKFLFLVLISLHAVHSTAADLKPPQLAGKIFLGQTYPSGNLYVVPFTFAAKGATDLTQDKHDPLTALKVFDHLVNLFSFL